MKKLISLLSLFMVLTFASTAFATWDIDVSSPSSAGDYVYFNALCTSDGSQLTATNLMSSTNMPFPNLVKGGSLMWVYVVPGTTTVAPDTTIDITLTNDFDAELWADTGISNTTNSWHQAWEDMGSYPPILTKLNLALNDIGTAGDQVTIYFVLWTVK